MEINAKMAKMQNWLAFRHKNVKKKNFVCLKKPLNLSIYKSSKSPIYEQS